MDRVLTHIYCTFFVDEGVLQTLSSDVKMPGLIYRETVEVSPKNFSNNSSEDCLALKMNPSKLAHLHLWHMHFVQEIGERLNFCSERMVSLTQLSLYHMKNLLSIGREGK